MAQETLKAVWPSVKIGLNFQRDVDTRRLEARGPVSLASRRYNELLQGKFE